MALILIVDSKQGETSAFELLPLKKSLKQKSEDISAHVRRLETELENKKGSEKQLQQKLEDISTQVRCLEAEFENKKGSEKQLQQKLEDINAQVHRLEGENRDLKDRITEFESQPDYHSSDGTPSCNSYEYYSKYYEG